MKALFLWFDGNPARYSFAASLVFAIVFYLALQPLLRPSPTPEKRSSDWIWGLAILALLFAGRWPFIFFEANMNPDESLMLSGAMTLRHDPAFWRAVDVGTAGPLNVYALLPVGWLTGHNGYLSARLTALALVAGTLWLLHGAMARLGGKHVARFGGFATLCFESFTPHADLTHYSTELVSLQCIAAGIYLGTREFLAEKPSRLPRFFFGLLLGAIPFAKLQGSLVGLLVAGSLFYVDMRKPDLSWRERLSAWSFMLWGAITPVLLFSVMALSTGDWQNAVTTYLIGNLQYTGVTQMTLVETIDGLLFVDFVRGDLVQPWLGGSVLVLLAATLTKRPWSEKSVRGLIFVGLCFAVTVFSILRPFRPTPHYLQYLVVPLVLLGGVSSGLLLHSWHGTTSPLKRLLLAAALVLGGLSVMIGWGGKPNPIVGYLAGYKYSTPIAALQFIGRITQPTEAVSIWGWMPSYYVEVERRPAQHEAATAGQIFPGPLRSFYRQRLLRDLATSNPPVFVDAVGPGNFSFSDRAIFAHDVVFPELAALVEARYALVADLNGSRIYLRNDLLERVKLPIRAHGPP